jgi:hypothetical protein
LRTAPVIASRMSVSMLILRTPNLMASWISLHRHAVGFLHLAAVLVDDGQQVLRHARLPCITRWVFGMRAWISLMRLMARMSPVGLRLNL